MKVTPLKTNLSLPMKRDLKGNKTYLFNEHRRLILPQRFGYSILPFDKIRRVQAESNYTMLFMENSKPILISRTMKFVEDQLDNRFMRIHRSSIINLGFVHEFNVQENSLVLDDGTEVKIARRKKEALKTFFKAQLSQPKN